MRIKFHGPLGEVTGSCYELRDEELDVHFLVDYGMKQGVTDASSWNHAQPPFDPQSLDFVMLTHAHIDHCGLIPLLHKSGFKGRVMCTRETAELAELNLLDSCKHDAPYDRQHVEAINWWEPPAPVFNRSHQIHRGLSVTFRRTAHMLGSASLRVEWGPFDEHKEITFSGDIGNNTRGDEFQPLMRHRIDPFEPRSKTSYVVMESTYGGRARSMEEKNFDTRLARLKEHVVETALQKEGCLIIPCFAIGRTQAVLFDLHYLFAQNARLREIPVLFDARLAQKVNRVYAKAFRRASKADGPYAPMWVSEQLHKRMGLASNSRDDTRLLSHLLTAIFEPAVEMPPAAKQHPSPLIRQWQRIWELVGSTHGLPQQTEGPCIVVTGGGMCNGGPVANYLAGLMTESRNKVLFTGYCCPETNGGKLLQLQNESIEQRQERTGRVNWAASSHSLPLADVHADVARIGGYSGHADHNGLLDWFFGRYQGRNYPAGWTVFLTHGADNNRKELERGIYERARELDADEAWSAHDLEVQLPQTSRDWYDLDTGVWTPDVDVLLGQVLPQWNRLDANDRYRVIDELSARMPRLSEAAE